ncbi:ABC transporter permease [Mycetocola sp. JXN-3]|uniref:ABC transporter permease n=1 Tax=Mycetocola sp. JXN-3 TaxID=2116510 RepID=UPI00165D128D|nr:ABC transporter permease [Mycetocola sp. JXN-3]
MTAQDRYDALDRLPLTPVGQSGRSWLGMWASIKDIFAHREMLGLMVRRDIKARYKDSALGLVWTLVRPLTQLAIYYLVLGVFLNARAGIPDFAVYVFTGLTAYGLFSEIVGGGTASIIGNSGLIKKVYLPREVFPLASVGSALFNFAIQMVILIAASLLLGSEPITWQVLYFIPSVLVLLVWATALALLLSAWNVYLRDVQYLVEVVIMLMLWASPIVYSWSAVQNVAGNNIFGTLYSANPVTLAVMGFQRAFWPIGATLDTPHSPDNLLLRLIIALVVGLVALFLAQRVFARLQGNFAQAI